MKRRVGYRLDSWPLRPINEDLGHAEALRYTRGNVAPIISGRQILASIDAPDLSSPGKPGRRTR